MAPTKKHGSDVSGSASSSAFSLKMGAKAGFYAGLLSGFCATIIYLFIVRTTTYSDALAYPLYNIYTRSLGISQKDFVASRLALFVSTPILVGALLGPALGIASLSWSIQHHDFRRLISSVLYGVAFWFVLLLAGYLIIPGNDYAYLSILIGVSSIAGLLFSYSLIRYSKRGR